MATDDARQRKVVMAILVVALLLALGLLFYFFFGKDAMVPDDTSGRGGEFPIGTTGDFGEENYINEESYDEEVPILTDEPAYGSGTTIKQITLPPPSATPTKTEAPLPQYVPDTSVSASQTVGFMQGYPEIDMFVPGSLSRPPEEGGTTYTYAQLRALKTELIDLCKANVRTGFDGSELRDRFIRILNDTLDIAISMSDIDGIDVVYHPQVNEVIQSIDSESCKDLDPSVPSR